MIKRVNLRIHVCLLAVFFLLGCVSDSKSIPRKIPRSNLSISSEKSGSGEMVRQAYCLLESNYVEPIKPDTMMKGAIEGLEKMKRQAAENGGGTGFEVPTMPGDATAPGFSGRSGLDGILTLFRASVERNRGYSEFRIAEGMVKGFVESLDPYSTLLTPEAFEKVRIDSKSLIRGTIPIESVESTMLQPGYGYIRIKSFRENTTDEIRTALNAFEKDGPLDGLVLDLRANPGGLFNQAVEVSDLFLGEGAIVAIKGRLDKHNKIYSAHENGTFADFPMVVLIDSGSASASEIVAGALQDRGRATLMGNPTFGKGSIQTVDEIMDGYGLKYTVALYYTPNGRSIQSKGIQPDVTADRTNKSEDAVNFALGILSGAY